MFHFLPIKLSILFLGFADNSNFYKKKSNGNLRKRVIYFQDILELVDNKSNSYTFSTDCNERKMICDAIN